MAKLPKSERDAIRLEGRAEREPFRPSSQNAFMEPNLEEIYREEASAGHLVPRGHIAHRICRPLDYYICKTEGING